MKKIIAYLLFMLAVDISFLITIKTRMFPESWYALENALLCTFTGGLGGAVYCLRGVYLNACVRKQWDNDWQPWYYIRPLVSHVCGAISFLFLKAGLLVLEAKSSSDSTNLGFLALAFIAGLNVDKFITKIEDIAQASWGIEKSRTANGGH
jgi:hypothetical protein